MVFMFHVKAKKKRFTAAASSRRQGLKFEMFTSSFGRLRQQITPKIVLHVQHDYFSLILPIMFLICDVVVAVDFVSSKLPGDGNEDETNLHI